MEELLGKVAQIRETIRRYGDEICQLLGISPEVLDPRSGCFGMLFNHSTFTREVLSYYQNEWRKPRFKVTEQEKDRVKQENGERCVLALKWLFISSLSSMEFSTKAAIVSYPENSPVMSLIEVRGRYVYLNDIMKNSLNDGLISGSEYDDWQNLIFLRNCLIHNNGVSDRNKTFTISETKVEARADKMLQGKLDFFAILTDVAVERYFTWVKALIKEYGQ